ncbi:hypothetical protein HYT57_02570 [Candidatus Woesearchaeota archaeon]|nr:hypothetical protein [Candidatus Woesearchaeota archaeon]
MKKKGVFDNIDKNIVNFMKKEGLIYLRYSLAIVFIWFGLLKSFGYSPASELVTKTIYFVDPNWFVPFLGWWEFAIGFCLLFKPLIRAGIFLMFLQMIGTFLPLILLPSVVYGPVPFSLTLEGQYIIKNIVLIGAAIVIGSHVRDKNKDY